MTKYRYILATSIMIFVTFWILVNIGLDIILDNNRFSIILWCDFPIVIFILIMGIKLIVSYSYRITYQSISYNSARFIFVIMLVIFRVQLFLLICYKSFHLQNFIKSIVSSESFSTINVLLSILMTLIGIRLIQLPLKDNVKLTIKNHLPETYNGKPYVYRNDFLNLSLKNESAANKKLVFQGWAEWTDLDCLISQDSGCQKSINKVKSSGTEVLIKPHNFAELSNLRLDYKNIRNSKILLVFTDEEGNIYTYKICIFDKG